MSLDQIFNWLGTVTIVAGLFVLVSSRQTAQIVNSLAAGVIGVLRAATGQAG